MKYREEIDALYREIYPALYGYAHSALGSVSLAEDAVSSATLSVDRLPVVESTGSSILVVYFSTASSVMV